MDFSEMVKVSERADLAYMEWYAGLSDEKKAQMHLDSQNFVANKIRHDVRYENPFATESDITMRFIELTQKDDYPEAVFSFIRQKMTERSEQEWQERFKALKKRLGWSYDDMARFMGASSGNAVKASINRQLPAFAKLAVCIFETMDKRPDNKF